MYGQTKGNQCKAFFKYQMEVEVCGVCGGFVVDERARLRVLVASRAVVDVRLEHSGHIQGTFSVS
jgi:hypothetical protein